MMRTFRDLQVGDTLAQFGGSALVLEIDDFLVNGVPAPRTKLFTLLEERPGTSSPTPTVRVVDLATEAHPA